MDMAVDLEAPIWKTRSRLKTVPFRFSYTRVRPRESKLRFSFIMVAPMGGKCVELFACWSFGFTFPSAPLTLLPCERANGPLGVHFHRLIFPIRVADKMLDAKQQPSPNVDQDLPFIVELNG
jgi:hypothetical protein